MRQCMPAGPPTPFDHCVCLCIINEIFIILNRSKKMTHLVKKSLLISILACTPIWAMTSAGGQDRYVLGFPLDFTPPIRFFESKSDSDEKQPWEKFPNYFAELDPSTSRELFESAINSVLNRVNALHWDEDSKQYATQGFFAALAAYVNRQDSGAQVYVSGGVIRSVMGYISERVHIEKEKDKKKEASKRRTAEDILKHIASSKRPLQAVRVLGMGSDLDILISLSDEKVAERRQIFDAVKEFINTAEKHAGLREMSSPLKKSILPIGDVKDFEQQTAEAVAQGGSTLDFLSFNLRECKLKVPTKIPAPYNFVIERFFAGVYDYIAPDRSVYTSRDTDTAAQIIRGFRPLLEIPFLRASAGNRQILVELETLISELKTSDKPLSEKAVEQFDKMIRNARFGGARNRLLHSDEPAIQLLRQVVALRPKQLKIPEFLPRRSLTSAPKHKALPDALEKALMPESKFIEEFTDKVHGKYYLYHGTPEASRVMPICRNGLCVSRPGQDGERTQHGRGAYTSHKRSVATEYGKSGAVIEFEFRVTGNARVLNYDDIDSTTTNPEARAALLAEKKEAESLNQDFFERLAHVHGIDIIIAGGHVLVQNSAVLVPPKNISDLIRIYAGIVKTALISGGDVGMEIDHYKHLRELGLAVGEDKNPSLRELLEDVSGEIKSLDQEARLKQAFTRFWRLERSGLGTWDFGRAYASDYIDMVESWIVVSRPDPNKQRAACLAIEAGGIDFLERFLKIRTATGDGERSLSRELADTLGRCSIENFFIRRQKDGDSDYFERRDIENFLASTLPAQQAVLAAIYAAIPEFVFSNIRRGVDSKFFDSYSRLKDAEVATQFAHLPELDALIRKAVAEIGTEDSAQLVTSLYAYSGSKRLALIEDLFDMGGASSALAAQAMARSSFSLLDDIKKLQNGTEEKVAKRPLSPALVNGLADSLSLVEYGFWGAHPIVTLLTEEKDPELLSLAKIAFGRTLDRLAEKIISGTLEHAWFRRFVENFSGAKYSEFGFKNPHAVLGDTIRARAATADLDKIAKSLAGYLDNAEFSDWKAELLLTQRSLLADHDPKVRLAASKAFEHLQFPARLLELVFKNENEDGVDSKERRPASLSLSPETMAALGKKLSGAKDYEIYNLGAWNKNRVLDQVVILAWDTAGFTAREPERAVGILDRLHDDHTPSDALGRIVTGLAERLKAAAAFRMGGRDTGRPEGYVGRTDTIREKADVLRTHGNRWLKLVADAMEK